MIKYNTNDEGYVANWIMMPDVGNSQPYDGPLPENWTDVYKYCHVVDGIMVLDEEKKAAAEAQAAMEEARRHEIEELTAWLLWYDQQVATYERCVRLGIPSDINMLDLNEQAKTKQTRLIEISGEQ